ncbi:hypothetical protein GCM10010222_48360 [Streptomyces tanashiensis]|nr:hypothetical protein GCM10010222_48360 [Streptomyces tanashiensis]
MRGEHGTGADPQHEQPEIASVGVCHGVLQVREADTYAVHSRPARSRAPPEATSE